LSAGYRHKSGPVHAASQNFYIPIAPGKKQVGRAVPARLAENLIHPYPMRRPRDWSPYQIPRLNSGHRCIVERTACPNDSPSHHHPNRSPVPRGQ
jgi:hypothetical protein